MTSRRLLNCRVTIKAWNYFWRLYILRSKWQTLSGSALNSTRLLTPSAYILYSCLIVSSFISRRFYFSHFSFYTLSSLNHCIQGGPKKVSHYRESLNRIKNRQPGYIFTNFDYKMSTRILYVRIKYSMYNLICDVTSSVAVFEAAI